MYRRKLRELGLAGVNLSLHYRKVLVVLIQLGLVVAAYVGSFILRLDLDPDQVPWDLVLRTLPLLVAIHMGSLALFRLYRGLWTYVSVVDLVQITKATTVGVLAFAFLEIAIFGLEDFPRSVFILNWVGNIFLLSGVRLFVRLVRERVRPMETPDRSLSRLLIIGAGDPGADLCKQALSNRTFRFKPVAFVDDHPDLHGTSILGVPIAGRLDRIPQVVKEYDADIAVIALHGASPAENFAVVELCRSAGVPFKILPTMPDLLEGPVNINRIRDVDPADLLGRAPAKLDRASIEDFIRGKHVLVTGAAGSVGSELARHIAGFNPKLLFLLDHSENSLLFLEAEIRASFPEVSLVAHVCDVTAYEEMERVMLEHRPQLVFHAAAHKHVPLMERTPGKAVKNNVGGTYTLARCAMNAGVDTFVLVSTDKAVNPTSVMGATKRLAELMLQELDQGSNTRFVSVRFGNVLGSNASVVPIFKQQIANGGPVTVTHPDVQRYFMSVSEAAGLILQAGAVGRGGDILVLDMGVPVKIVSLAETLITLSGFQPYGDIDIVFTGLRAGEKMSEELSFDDEVFDTTGYEKLWVLKQGVQTQGIVPRLEEMLSVLPKLTADEVKLRLKGFVPEYGPESLVKEVVGPAHGGNRPSPTP